MNTYEVFTEKFSVILEAYSLSGAIRHFFSEHTEDIIAIIQVNHPIHKELIK